MTSCIAHATATCAIAMQEVDQLPQSNMKARASRPSVYLGKGVEPGACHVNPWHMTRQRASLRIALNNVDVPRHSLGRSSLPT